MAVYVELPYEDAEIGVRGLLQKSKPGRAQSTVEWGVGLNGTHEAIFFVKVKGSPCLLYHERCDLACVINGFGITVRRCQDQLDCFSTQIQE